MENIPSGMLKNAFDDNERMKNEKLESEEIMLKLCYSELEKFEKLAKENEKDFKGEFPTLNIEEDDKDIDFRNKEDGTAYRNMQEDYHNLKEEVAKYKKEIQKIETNRERRTNLIKTNQEN